MHMRTFYTFCDMSPRESEVMLQVLVDRRLESVSAVELKEKLNGRHEEKTYWRHVR